MNEIGINYRYSVAHTIYLSLTLSHTLGLSSQFEQTALRSLWGMRILGRITAIAQCECLCFAISVYGCVRASQT